MNNLKTALTVVLLLGVLYGAYQFLNQRDVPPPAEAQLQLDQGIAPPMIEFGTPGADFGPVPVSVPTSPGEATSPAIAAPSDFTPPPSFAVLPKRDEPKFDELPKDSAPALTSTATSDTAHADSSVRKTDHSAYEEPAARVATRDGSTGARADLPNLQENPWYRPDRNPATSAPVGASASPEATRQASRAAFERSWFNARELVENGKFAEALAELTAHYGNTDLAKEEQQQLQKALDSLAGRVIYSTEHYLEQPHVVRSEETLLDIASKYNVQWQLLQNINGVRDPYVLVPKTQLKIVRGPFRAEVSLQTSHLTLFVDKYYAGRFPVSIGRDPAPPPGAYSVRDKREGKEYYPPGGRTVAAGHAVNPYGLHWIDLGADVCIHGSAERDVSPDYGCISLSPRDAADVFGILSLGSAVVVRR